MKVMKKYKNKNKRFNNKIIQIIINKKLTKIKNLI